MTSRRFPIGRSVSWRAWLPGALLVASGGRGEVAQHPGEGVDGGVVHAAVREARHVHREAFRQDEEALYQQHQLSKVECQLLRLRDWRGLIHYGAIFFVLEKWAAVLGVSNLHIYAAMRGQSLDEFLQTRNAPGAIYSVAAVPQEPLPETTV